MSNQNQPGQQNNRASRTRTPARSPASSRAAAQKPGQQQQDPNRQGQNPAGGDR